MNKKKYLFVLSVKIILFMILLLLMFSSYYDTENIKLIMIYGVILLILSIITNIKNNIFFIFGTFLILYYIPLIQKFYFGYKIEPFDYTLNGQYGYLTLLIYSIFSITYSIFTIVPLKSKHIKQNVNVIKNLKVYNNTLLFYGLIILILILTFISHKGDYSISGGYGSGTSSKSIINEYLILLFPICYAYSGKKRIREYIIYLAFIVYSVVNILYGDRIGILMLGIMLFLIFLNERCNYKHIIGLSIILGIIFIFIGHFRVYGEFTINNSRIINSNAGNVFVASNQIVKLKDNIGNIEEKKSFFEYLLRIIIPQKYLSDLSDPGAYAAECYKESLGGGFICSYFYLWFGILGVILISIIIANLFISIKEYKSDYKIVFVLACVSFFPRWAAYQPIQIVKVPLIACALYGIFSIINKILKGVRV